MPWKAGLKPGTALGSGRSIRARASNDHSPGTVLVLLSPPPSVLELLKSEEYQYKGFRDTNWVRA